MMLLVLLPSKCVLYCVRGMLNVLLYSMHSTLLFVVVVSVECVVFFLGKPAKRSFCSNNSNRLRSF
jgi:hypothetical protein